MSKDRLDDRKRFEDIVNNTAFQHKDILWLIARVKELEKENTGLKQDLKCVSEQLESVSDVVWEGKEG